jgi:hypothetical protein
VWFSGHGDRHAALTGAEREAAEMIREGFANEAE